MSQSQEPADGKSLATFIVDYQTHTDASGQPQFKTLVTQMDVETDAAASQEWGSIERHKPCEWIQQRLQEILADQGINADPPPPMTRLNASIHAYHVHALDIEFSLEVPPAAVPRW
ncbi:MAG: hypothetical protein BWK73_46680 [Thiothrix lacustris]|uniref:Uncharacterized protein n=1 Tax=Thiothrix lacustris TaxID=525917 RepID=A0A1Y1QA59_9GAMM|nr:MAG: hypothetical protein BWK73_46680 [Thiothrix lacustris]